MTQKDTFLTFVQALRGTSSVAVNCNSARVAGKYAGALDKTVEIEQVFEPLWSNVMLSGEAKLELELEML